MHCGARIPGATGILMVLDNVDHLDGTSLWVLNQLLAEPDIKMLASHRSDRQLRMELMESVVARQLSVVTLEELTLEQLRTFLEHRLAGPARPQPGARHPRRLRRQRVNGQLARRRSLGGRPDSGA